MLWQYPHTILASVVTASFVVTGVGAWYLLVRRHEGYAKKTVRLGIVVGLIASLLVAFPTGDRSSALVAEHHPAAFAAMEGAFHTERGAPMVLIGQPDVERMRLDNPIEAPYVLSLLTHYRWDAEIRGLDDFPKEDWPQNIPLLYYAYHVMVGLGTIFIALYAFAALRLRKGALFRSRPMQWALLLAIPFPYIANILGWLTTELGRQPWVIHGVLRTRDAYSENVSAGNATFTLIGFMGLYALLAVLFLFLVGKRIVAGPDAPLGLTPAPLDPHAGGAAAKERA
jgi:cytochrome d ubiquinol oxidase subunit I